MNINYKNVKNHKNTMDLISEEINKSYRKYFAERAKTVEDKCKEANLNYHIVNNCIVIDRETSPLGNQREDYIYENERDLENNLVKEKI